MIIELGNVKTETKAPFNKRQLDNPAAGTYQFAT